MKRSLIVAAALLLLGLAAAWFALNGSGTWRDSGRPAPAAARNLSARFAVLRPVHSNRCGMSASMLSTMPSEGRLQGSCCFPMDYRSYTNQVKGLKRYARNSLIPKDAYDIPVSLAKRLVSYQSIRLTHAQKGTYDRAVPLSDTKGPCCCPCWRWTAFGGQAKYLIARRGWSARQIAELWGLEEGCGGPSHTEA